MPGITSFVNKLIAKDERINLFYNTNARKNLAVALMAGDADGNDGKTYAAGIKDQDGIVVNPSDLANASFQGFNAVFGITLLKGEENPTYDVSLLSPVYRPLTTTQASNTSIAASSDGKVAYVYFLSGTSQATYLIKEVQMNTITPSSISGTTGQVLLGSRLAAYYNPIDKKRYVIFQGNDSNTIFNEYCINDGSIKPLQNTGDSVKKTTLAITCLNGKVYLYYIGSASSGVLRKIVKTGESWGASNTVNGSTPVDASSQLSVTTANDINHIFYIQEGETTGAFSHLRDDDL